MTITADNNWGVFRCSPANTIAHLEALTIAEVGAYVPTIIIRRRIPRSTSFERKEIAVLPTFIFVEEVWLDEAATILGADAKIMLINGRRVSIPDHHIAEMDRVIRGRIESNIKRNLRGAINEPPMPDPKKVPEVNDLPEHDFKIGESVRINAGPFAGINATINEINRDRIGIDFGGFLGRVEVSAFLLDRNTV